MIAASRADGKFPITSPRSWRICGTPVGNSRSSRITHRGCGGARASGRLSQIGQGALHERGERVGQIALAETRGARLAMLRGCRPDPEYPPWDPPYNKRAGAGIAVPRLRGTRSGPLRSRRNNGPQKKSLCLSRIAGSSVTGLAAEISYRHAILGGNRNREDAFIVLGRSRPPCVDLLGTVRRVRFRAETRPRRRPDQGGRPVPLAAPPPAAERRKETPRPSPARRACR